MIYPPGFSGAYLPIRPGCEVKEEEEEKDSANNSVDAAARGDGTAAAVEGTADASAIEDAYDEEAAAAAAARAAAQAEAALLQRSGSADAVSFFSALMAQVFLSLAESDVCAYDGIFCCCA